MENTTTNPDVLERFLRYVQINTQSEDANCDQVPSSAVQFDPHYGKVILTERGREVGSAIWYRHRLIRTFLVQELGVDFERADSEACMMEHALSEDTMNRWLAYLEKQGISVEE